MIMSGRTPILFALQYWYMAAVALLPAMAFGEDAISPYVAYVSPAKATLRSGPGESFYATENLSRGFQVEIYAHENEFAAIRPPKSSFSWTPAADVRVVSAGIAEVIEDGAVAWVGSSVDQPAEPRYQVELRRGERLQILGEKRIKEGDASVWYKIAPPAGEFRWVRLAELTRDPPAEAAAAGEARSNTGWTVRSSSKKNGQSQGVSRPELLAKPKNNPRSQTQGLLPVVANEPFELTLGRIELELSLLASRPADEWQLDSLQTQSQQLSGRASSTIERAEARRLEEKIADFAELRDRRASLANWQSERPNSTANLPLQNNVSATGEDEETDAEAKPIKPPPESVAVGSILKQRVAEPNPTGPNFDGRGKLLPVVTDNARTPAYALMDDNGKLIQYITPAPGLNLHRYLRKRIGVYGQKSFVPWLKANNLTASRVVVLER